MPSTNFIGCIKNCPKMKEFDNYLAILFTNDYSDEINIEDQINKWLFNETQSNNINYIIKYSKQKSIASIWPIYLNFVLIFLY